MSGLRSLLRLEDKVAAEGRRLRNIGGPSMRWVGPTAIAAAAALHGAILLLPAMRVRATLPASSPVPDFPLVWRPSVPASAQPPTAPNPRATSAVVAVPPHAPKHTETATAASPIATEPVPEPAPEPGLGSLSADMDALIPDPDAPPPSLELGPPSGAAPATAQDAAPVLVERVPPVYPMAARTFRAEADVTLRLTVLPDGRVGKVSVEQCSRTGFGFEAAAQNAVKRWRYQPAPFPSGPRTVTVKVHFQQQEGLP